MKGVGVPPRLCRLHHARPSEGADPSGADLVRKVRARLTRMGWIAGVAGAVVAFNSVGFLIPIFIDPGERTELALLNAPLLVLYGLVAGLASMRYWQRHFDARTRWLVEGREPDEDEHRLTLRMAGDAARITGVTWGLAGALFFVLDTAAHSWEFGAVVLATVWLGGETASALDYLLSERILRPITARALAARLPDGPVAPGVRRRLAMAWSLGTGVPLFGVLVVAVAGVAKPDVDTEYVAAAVLFLGVVALAVGLLATLVAAKAIAEPITSVQHGLEHMEHGDLDVHVPVSDAAGWELHPVATGDPFHRRIELHVDLQRRTFHLVTMCHKGFCTYQLPDERRAADTCSSEIRPHICQVVDDAHAAGGLDTLGPLVQREVQWKYWPPSMTIV